MAAMISAAMMGMVAGPSEARRSINPMSRDDVTIRIDGINYEGTWAFVGSKPYVNVESFGKALGLPRVHNVKNWYLGRDGKPKGSPFQLAVESAKGTLPTLRFGGATMVELPAALKALGIQYHYDTMARTFEVGEPYHGQYMIGAWYRWYANTRSWYNWGGYGNGVFLEDLGHEMRGYLNNTSDTWPELRKYPRDRPRPYPDSWHNEDNYHHQKDYERENR